MADWKNRIVGTDVKPASFFLANEKNWRIHPGHQQSALVGSLAEVGWVQDVIVNLRSDPSWGADRGVETLVDGHLRVSLALREGDETPIPVKYIDLLPGEENIILSSFDPIAALAVADKEKLDALLRDTKPADAALQQMLSELAAREGLYTGNSSEYELGDAPEPQLDRAIELQKKWGTAIGQLWVIDSKTVPGKAHRLMCGDSQSVEVVTRLMAGAHALAMVTDPPYAVDYIAKAKDMNRLGYGHSRAKSGSAIEGDELTEDECAHLWRRAFLAALDVALTEHAAWYVWHAAGRATRTMLNLLSELDILHHQTIIWVKNNFVIGRCDYQGQHEPCFYGWKKGNRPDFYGPKNQTTIWNISRDSGTPIHPTQKPIEVFAKPLVNHLKVGEVAYDPFAGASPIIVAAEQTQRIGYGCDKSPFHVAVSIQRFADMGLQPQLIES